MADIKPYKIDVPDAELTKLKNKLADATFPDTNTFSDDWNYGTSLSDVKRLANYWKNGFDWRAQEKKLNEAVPHFTTNISIDGFDNLDIHFVHQKSTRPGSIPLLFVHGWPGSFIEVLKILPLLTEPAKGPSFHVVAPSLPNYAFSEGVQKRGFSIPQYAETMHKVMMKLGYDKYVTQGGDWGFAITRLIGYLYPGHCMASHINMIAARPPTFSQAPWQYIKHAIIPYDASEKNGIARSAWFKKEGYGYNLEQSTKPNTLGFAFADSPVALLAWIYEKLHDWTDSYPWTDDEILTWISVYQFSRAGPAANVRIYYERQHESPEQVAKAISYVPQVPLGLSYFPKDLFVPPKTWGRTLGPVVFEATHSDGGHFAAHERPEKLARDLQNMFSANGGAYKVAQAFQSKL